MSERLEYRLLLLRKDADPSVRNSQCNHAPGSVEDFVLRVPTGGRGLSGERDPSLLGEFEGVAQQVVEDLLQALRVGWNRGWQTGSHVDCEAKLGGLGHVPECPLEQWGQL